MKLKKIVNYGIPVICGVLLAVIVGLPFGQVVLRNCIGSSMSWSDEISQFCMTWMVLLGSIWATKNNQHLNTGLKLHQKLNKRLVCLIDGILNLLLVVVSVVVAYQTALFASIVKDIESLSISWIKMGCIFTVMPLAMLGLCYYSFKGFIKNLLCIFKHD
jgi:TRAP-type C4-dicarboxylate transport system permease small subunit